MMIKEITASEYERFLLGNNATKYQISINTKGIHYGYYLDNKLVGVISTNSTKNTKRVKGFMVNQVYANRGIGSSLLEYVIDDTKTMTTFSTIHSRTVFERNGFEVVNTKENNIAFLRREPKSDAPKLTDEMKSSLDDEIGNLAVLIVPLDENMRNQAIEYVTNKVRRIK